MSSADRILALDVGTQSVRAIVFDPAGTLIAMARVPIEPYVSPRPGWAEQDPELYWQSIGAASRRVLADPTVRPGSIAGLTLTTQRGRHQLIVGQVLLDGPTCHQHGHRSRRKRIRPHNECQGGVEDATGGKRTACCLPFRAIVLLLRRANELGSGSAKSWFNVVGRLGEEQLGSAGWLVDE